MINILAYADDLVLLAPSWRALQQLLDKLSVAATSIDMLCNIKKTVCMVFNPKCRSNIVAQKFIHSLIYLYQTKGPYQRLKKEIDNKNR